EVAGVHATALVDESAVVPASATGGPYSVLGPGVELGERVRIGPHVLIERDSRIGDDVRISKGAVLGTDPQDLKYAGERTFLEVGARTRVREFATLNRGTAASGLTSVGADCLIMAYVHIAHDCRIDDHVVLANAVNMGGHVEIGEWAIVGGMTPIHQFVRIGRHAMVGGASRAARDIPPYTIASGNPCFLVGINSVGLGRRGFDEASIRALRRAYREIFRSEDPLGTAVADFALDGASPEVSELVTFLRESERGVAPGRRSRSTEGAEPGGTPHAT
ncbi:MAG: acyl-ACP--UDP-N-acetylglucosamine O-acyltransferase, partial [Gemmatimonadota bacterium]|nr:acyl-ACP--UDP-N-acetylglucosamine O-acyltransferase [Gemmatimonadota bacterium]